MPTYQYRCSDCGNELEAVQKFTDPSLTECPTCTGNLRKVFNAVGVVFKGSGFYLTDYRSESYKEGAKADSKPAASNESSKSDSKSESKSEPTPAAKSESKPSTSPKPKSKD